MFEYDKYCLDGEVWKDIYGYEGTYQASNLGRIRSVDGKKTESTRHGIQTWRGRILKSRGSNPVTGYRVTLWKNKTMKDFLVARLVCAAFHGIPIDPKMTVNHIDGNRFNNDMTNLEWMTLADNIRHGFETGLYPTKRIKLKIGEDIQEFKSMSAADRHIGRATGYTSNAVHKGIRMYTKSNELIEILPF